MIEMNNRFWGKTKIDFKGKNIIKKRDDIAYFIPQDGAWLDS